MWGVNNEGILPTYTRTAESFDVLAKLFSLLTRLKEGTPTDSITDECILLPSQVMIPPMDIVIPAKGLSYTLLASNRASQAIFTEEPTFSSLDGKDTLMDKLVKLAINIYHFKNGRLVALPNEFVCFYIVS